MACIGKTLQVTAIVFNILFFLVGCAILGCGIYLQLEQANYLDLFGDHSGYSAIIFIVVGGIMMTISFFGCIGAWSDSPCLLKTFAYLIVVILLVQIVGFIVIYFHKDDIQDQLKKGLENYNTTDATDGVTKVWDSLQQHYQCCGITEPEDWEQRLGEYIVPDSCCKEIIMGCGKPADPDNPVPDRDDIYRVGCKEKLKTDVTMIASVGGILGIVQLLGILVACCMARRGATHEDYEMANMD